MKRLLLQAAALAATCTLLAILTPTAFAQFGTLKGRFVWKGKPIVAKPAVLNANQKECGPLNIKVPTLEVGPDGGVGGLLVWLYLPKGAPAPKMKPVAGKPPVPVLDNIKCKFSPRATLVRTGQDFEVKNSDKIAHSVQVTFLENRAMNQNLNLPPGAKAKFNLPKRERFPIPVLCGFHNWMKSYLVVTDHPYAVLTKPDGTFTLELPIGLHEVQVRHLVGTGGYVDNVTYKGKLVKWPKGKIGQVIINGENKVGIPAGKVVDLGDIELR